MRISAYLLIIVLLFGVFNMALADEKGSNTSEFSPASVWSQFKGYISDIWAKICVFWQKNVKTEIDKIAQEFNKFIDQKRIRFEMQKETSEMWGNICGAGNFVKDFIFRKK